MSEQHYIITLKKGANKDEIFDEMSRDTSADSSVDSNVVPDRKVDTVHSRPSSKRVFEMALTDEEANNYNPNAVVDDGSCVLESCFGDVDGDNAVTVSDLLEILAEFGCTEGCTTDVSGDGATTVADLLELLSVFGSSCS